MVPKMQVKELVRLTLASSPHHAHERASIILLLVALADYKCVSSKFVTYFIKSICLNLFNDLFNCIIEFQFWNA